MGVSSHAHGDEGARAAVEAGVRTIEHGTYMSPETLARMVEMGTYLVPTMAIVRDLTIPGGDYDNAVLRLRGHHMLPRMHEMVTNAHDMGVKIVLNHKVQDLMAEKQAGYFDAVFVAVGAHIGKKVDIPARDAGKMLDAVSFLRDVDRGEPPKLGRRVAIEA